MEESWGGFNRRDAKDAEGFLQMYLANSAPEREMLRTQGVSENVLCASARDAKDAERFLRMYSANSARDAKDAGGFGECTLRTLRLCG